MEIKSKKAAKPEGNLGNQEKLSGLDEFNPKVYAIHREVKFVQNAGH